MHIDPSLAISDRKSYKKDSL